MTFSLFLSFSLSLSLSLAATCNQTSSLRSHSYFLIACSRMKSQNGESNESSERNNDVNFFLRASNETSRIKSHWVEHHLFSQPRLFKNLFPIELNLSLRRTKFPSSVSSPRHSSIIAISHSYSPCLCLWWTKYAKSFQIITHEDKFYNAPRISNAEFLNSLAVVLPSQTLQLPIYLRS